MRLFLSILVVSLGVASNGCSVKVEEKPPRLIDRDDKKDVDIKIDTPRVDVNVEKE